jgi:putative membrane protein
MRWVYLVITVVLVLAMIVFALQNLDLVTMSFLHFSVSAPLAVLVVVVYVLGAVTGGSFFALVRRLAEGSRRHP